MPEAQLESREVRGVGTAAGLPSGFIFAGIFFLLLALHAPLLHVPYYWDEAGYYVPAARDLLLHGALIPQSTLSNAHPPLVMAYLALWWKLFGFRIVVTRVAMIGIAAFSLLGVFRLARRVANLEVAVTTTLCTAIYPVFFAQSSLAQVDLAAAGLTIWALHSYAVQRRVAAAVWFCLAVLAKETAVLAPLALFGWEMGWELLRPVVGKRVRAAGCLYPKRDAKLFVLLAPVAVLSLWYIYHYHRTGYVLGNPEFVRYNVQSTMRPFRIALALLLRLWQLLGYMGLYALTLATLFAMMLPAIKDPDGQRQRIAMPVQLSFLAIMVTYLSFMAAIGGAVLARYMLPVIPLVILIGVSTLRRRMRSWRWMAAVVSLAFAAALFVNPSYGFPMEDNLAYRDYIVLHERAESFLLRHYPNARVLTAWPGNDELTRPFLGYVAQPMQVFRIEDFSVEQLAGAVDFRSQYGVALVFSTKYQPLHGWFDDWPQWQEWKKEFFGFHRDATPAAAAQILGGRLVYSEARKGQWAAVIEMVRVRNAELETTPSSDDRSASLLPAKPRVPLAFATSREPPR